MNEGRCRICCGVLFQTVSTDAAGHLKLMAENSEIEWENHGTNYYIWCPHCAAKNVAIRMKDTEDIPALDIVGAVMEDE